MGVKNGTLWLEFTSTLSSEIKLINRPLSSNFKIAETETSPLWKTAFTELFPKVCQSIRLSIKAAGAKRHISLKKVTVSVLNISGSAIFTTGKKDSSFMSIDAFPSL